MGRMMRLVISTLMFAISMCLIMWWFITPTTLGWAIEQLVTQHTQKFGDMVGVYTLYTCPIIILALLGTLHLHLTKKFPPSPGHNKSNGDYFYTRASRMWRMLWTRPVFINRMFGVMAVVDLVAIISTLVLVFWLFYAWYVPQAQLINATAGVDKAVAKTAQAGTMLGRVSAVLMSLLLLPVARNSPILRMIGLPFEQAVKYHKWVGYLLVAVVLAHGGSFIGVYAKTHTWHRLLSFTASPNGSGVVVVPGLVALLVAIYMVATSLPKIRRRHFNFFYYSHQLYIVFFAGFAYHVGVRTVGYTMGPIFLFFLDRFMRFWQSRQLIRVSKARVSFDGIIELKVPRSSTLTYDATSFLFLKVPGVSHLEWHPISTASSARDGAGEMTILIKKSRVHPPRRTRGPPASRHTSRRSQIRPPRRGVRSPCRSPWKVRTVATPSTTSTT